ncbi:unnamed protein product [Callosobruchus maculatus]|uniref:Transposase Tc1-like domain-containing protein n=1 Tax=Callosobruchus maculatus TaxID=64391 RepID=A0A653CB99_CALMS|nr:unnamed protein product [Callosobruchus maculatus]
MVKLMLSIMHLGGGSGIGRATCKILAREGASVVVADKNLQNVQDTVKSMPKAADQDHLGVELEVSEIKTIKNSLNKVLEKYKRPPTIIVNSAGITRDNFLLKLSEQDFDEVLDVNLKEIGCYTRRLGIGPQGRTKAHDDRFIILQSLRDRHATVIEIRNRLHHVRNTNVSERTIRRKLGEANLLSTGAELLRRHRVARLQFARNHEHCGENEWGNVY